MLAGPHDPEEIIRSIDKGLYSPNFGGGQVDITSGKFVFSANEAYLIEKGKLTTPVKGAMLIGDGPEVLSRISMVGNDLANSTPVSEPVARTASPFRSASASRRCALTSSPSAVLPEPRLGSCRGDCSPFYIKPQYVTRALLTGVIPFTAKELCP